MDNQDTKQAELIFQVKNTLGLIAVMLDNMPQYVQYHFCRVAAKLSDALCKVLGTEDLRVSELQHLAMKDVLNDWQDDDDLPDGLREVIKGLLAHLETLPEDNAGELKDFDQEIPIDNLTLWDIWSDESSNDQTDD